MSNCQYATKMLPSAIVTNISSKVTANSLARAVTEIHKLNTSPCTEIFAMAQNRRAHPLQYHLLLGTFSILPQYLRKLINIKSIGSTHSFAHLILLSPSISSLKMSNHSFNQTAQILWNNLPKSIRTFSYTLPNSPTTGQCSSLQLSRSKVQFRSHLKTYLFNISYPPWTDHMNLYPNSDVNRVLRAGEYIRSLRCPVFTGAI